MAYLVQKDAGAKLLKSYLPPFQGTWGTLPAYLLPDDAVQSPSLNVSLHGGVLRSRSGLKRFGRTNLQQKVIGSFLTVDTTNSKYPIISTRDRVYRFKDNDWQDITGGAFLTPLTAMDDDNVRMTSIQIGTSVYVLYANGVDRLKQIPQSTYELADITPVEGTIPVCTDICTSFTRIVGITPPYTVQWSEGVNDTFLAFRKWPSLNQFICSDTEDSLVAIRPIGTLGLAVYKEGNIFVGYAQQGSSAQAFRFEHRGEYEGPAGVDAILNIDGTHMRMTPTGRIGLFDGTQHSWIADGIWPFLQGDLDIAYAYKIFGVYSYKTAEAFFFYPRKGDNGLVRGMVIVNLPFPSAGINTFSYFLGRVEFSCSEGMSVRLFASDALPFVFSDSGLIFQVDKNTYVDNVTPFQCSFSTGLFRPPDTGDNYDVYFANVETYSDRGTSEQGTVEVSLLTSNILDTDGNESPVQQIDLRQVPISEKLGFDQDSLGSFLGVKYTWSSDAQFRYKGADIYGTGTL